ncbi:MAG: RDD family protein [Vicinamibacterales bacterium]|nr:RDD family protein [Vicinamibacterales bacterium]
MKCPKCGYLGFETGARCRHCGYDFSLSAPADVELPLRAGDTSAAPLADLDLTDLDRDEFRLPSGGLDLERLIGAEPPSPPPPRLAPTAEPVDRLPLFGSAELDDTPLIQAAGPPRPPLSVRRASPEVPRTRVRTTRTFKREEPSLGFEPEADAGAEASSAVRPSVYVRPGVPAEEVDAATGTARLMAGAIDLVLLAAIDAGVIYLTLQIAGLGADDFDVVPLGPLVAFLAMLNGGYLVALTAASGQTIGKMAAGIRVVSDGRGPLDSGRALLRAAASVLSLATLGAGFLPALLKPGGRTLHDRVAGTRVTRD